ncbi:MAG: indolepyruvate ferredoxin oxidoreductase [Chloroflexi bacterium RBG_19FT_COMBO_48_23]|nr:MAG: indolepyruvate ferredoxin oxidoreductase [Chloroflexi bacterium RBG_19FT_COMBO_48_23]
MANIEIDAPGTSQLFIGNEAIARGALEAGIGFAAAYPGTPSSEILGSLAQIAKKMGIYAEWSINEKVAMEAAAGASYAGVRALAAMKQNGINVVSDFLANLVMSGTGKGGLVLVSCDDPSAISSSNEQDTRPIAKWLDIPLVEPGDFQEAKDMTKWLFDLAEELGTLCMLRSVTRIAHARGNVKLGELPGKQHKAYFDQIHDLKNVMPTKFMPMPSSLRHFFLHMKLDKARDKFELSPFNRYVGPDKPDLLIITCGSCWLYSQDAVKALDLEDKVGILKLGTLWPLPEKFINKHLGKSQKILFVEEIDPFLERSVMEIVANLPSLSPHPTFYGKRSGHINAYGELNPNMVIKAISTVLELTYQPRDVVYGNKAEAVAKSNVPERSMTFCAGCPHRATFWAIRNAIKLDGRDGVVTGDIGCYSMALGPAGFFQVRTMHCMGAGAGVANGLGKLGQFGFDQPVLAVVGDSTFYHATIPALINGIYNQSKFILVILDNSATAMTGFQPHPGTGMTAMGEPTKVISMEALCRSLGARVEVCDPFDLESTTATLLEMMAEGGGAKVAIMRRQCELVRAKKEKPPYKVHVDAEKCIGEACGCDRLCTRIFLCPGLIWDKKTGKSKVDEVICNGCGVCVDVCPQGAIIKEAT